MTTINSGSGYRLLTEGETVLASDEVYWGARWLAQTKWPEDIGQTWGVSPACNLPRRRKLAPAIHSGEGWRLLEPGEVMQKDDQYLDPLLPVWRDRGFGGEGVAFHASYYPTRRRIPLTNSTNPASNTGQQPSPATMPTLLKEPINITITNTDQAYAMWHFLNQPNTVLNGTYQASGGRHRHLQQVPSTGFYFDGWGTLNEALRGMDLDPHLPLEEFRKPKPVPPVKSIGSHAVTYRDGAIYVGCQRVETADLTKLADFAREQKA